MENLQSGKRGIQGLISVWAVAALTIGFLVAMPSSPVFACEDSGRGKVGCEGEEREEGDQDGGDGSDSEQTDRDTSRPREGDTWTEYRYTECVNVHDDPLPGSCFTGAECPEGEAYYVVYTREWTYDGSRWTYDSSVGLNGWLLGEVENGCRDRDEVEDTEEVTEDVVIRAFNSRPLPSGEVGANPPNGRTLVNLDTIFYTEQGQEEFDPPLHEINQVVRIIATPTSYIWDFGDGNDASWDTMGRAWEEGVPMSEYNTHRYTETGGFDVTLRVQYEVQFDDGNGWQTISEPITSRPSDPFEVQVLEQRGRLGEGN